MAAIALRLFSCCCVPETGQALSIAPETAWNCMRASFCSRVKEHSELAKSVTLSDVSSPSKFWGDTVLVEYSYLYTWPDSRPKNFESPHGRSQRDVDIDPKIIKCFWDLKKYGKFTRQRLRKNRHKLKCPFSTFSNFLKYFRWLKIAQISLSRFFRVLFHIESKKSGS